MLYKQTSRVTLIPAARKTESTKHSCRHRTAHHSYGIWWVSRERYPYVRHSRISIMSFLSTETFILVRGDAHYDAIIKCYLADISKIGQNSMTVGYNQHNTSPSTFETGAMSLETKLWNQLEYVIQMISFIRGTDTALCLTLSRVAIWPISKKSKTANIRITHIRTQKNNAWLVGGKWPAS